LDVLTTLLIAAVSFIGVGLRSSLSTGIISLSLVYSVMLTGLLQYTVRLTIDVENNMVSTERLIHFSDLPSEGHDGSESAEELSNWPNEGQISFKQYQMRYRPGLELVLKGLTCDIRPREKIGICGRTGSGKSSMMLALFRVVEAAFGAILIDGVDISGIGLRQLRQGLSIIPQDPVLLSGTVRFNLDVS
jgi:ATP-binding cassette subfamily C (CFTR/MRP) protein 1